MKKNDGKNRNVEQWYTIGYLDQNGTLMENPFRNDMFRYHGYLSDLLRQTVRAMKLESLRDAVVAIIWPGQISRHVALHEAGAVPIRHVFADGRITS